MLEGIRILDLSRLLPGPYATQLLADLGAEVIRVERPHGDWMRGLGPYVETDSGENVGASFAQVNRGKKSLALDYVTPAGRELLLRLAERADVFVESFRPDMLARRGLGYEQLHARNPRLVYCSLSGYGQTGPYRNRAGHDLNYIALAGILELNGAEGCTPVAPPVQIADLAGGMRAALQILAALIGRGAAGAGCYLDIALYDAALDWMQTVVGATAQAEGVDPTRGSLPLAGALPCYGAYTTADGGTMSLGALEPTFWKGFCEAVGRPDLLERQFDRAAIADVAALFRERTRSEWTELAEHADICLEPALTVSGALAHVQARERLHEVNAHVPRLGEHTRELLREIGIEETEQIKLKQQGVIPAAAEKRAN